ncbi:hypothetical protein Tco_0764350, partial [Tanacetum coccineum]
MESSNSNSKERELQLTQLLVKKRHSHCMTWFDQLEIHLRDLYLNNLSYVLRLQLERENLHDVNAKTCLEVLRTQFKEFFASKGVNSPDHLNQCWQQDFKEYTLCEPDTYRHDLLENLDALEVVIHRAVITYGILRMKENEVNALKKSSWIESENSNSEHAFNKLVNESSGTESGKQDTSSSSGNYLTHVVDVDIKPVNDQVPFAEVDSNTTPDSTNMSYRGGEIDQDAEQYQVKSPLLNAEFFKTKDMVKKEVYNELANKFLQLEKHCSSRNSSKESYGSHDMAHKYYLKVAKKKTQDKNTNLKPSVMHTTSLQNTTNGSKPKPRSNNQTSRSLVVPKSSREMLNGVPLVDHSRNSSSFSDSKYFVCSTCQKCVFNANHDDCITKFLKEVNSRAKVQSPRSRNNIKPAKRIPNVNKPERWISKGYKFSPNKSSDVHEKPNTPISCLRWKPTGRIFKNAGLRWIPIGKMFTDSTTNLNSEPPNGLNDDITNPYECDQTLNVSTGTLNLSA